MDNTVGKLGLPIVYKYTFSKLSWPCLNNTYQYTLVYIVYVVCIGWLILKFLGFCGWVRHNVNTLACP